ncbi:CoB--CoM heterodisulfide reductase iron-sulfur subunit B family protein [Maridesulfovibrio hydrothermalis]|uniref:CoB--CoM heterodisulfide reductase n=1 Tax=Maridesulfovibrio hydrothermalis AM13 = DSM 14728 TaxID=1121451 RepID=L0R9Z6_9BACT|nr:CoB--CoM heterodisulfide reductase iron-sulfur subunit B family protein [Maridesulfovibrio hydrothermalis]CCO23608.1 CoB--CoM heterodisulfide reductase [Maridesulfovibrio hydrothermalis AM13 = DSM 14728]
MSDSLTYAYYPGCSGTGTSIEYDMSTRAVCAKLGVHLAEIPDWSCCGSTPAHTVDHTLSCALSARNLQLVEGMNLDTAVTPCPSCLTNLKTAERRMNNGDMLEKANKLLDTPYTGGVATKSVLQILVEDLGLDALKKLAVKPLKGLKVAAYYGCIMNRPPEVMQFDDPEHPMSMDNIMKALGATVLPFPLKVECCGASFGIPRKDIVMKLSGKLLDAADGLGVDALITACPLCQMNLDLRQSQINSATGAKHKIPVFYYTQLMGLALGLDEKELGIDKLCVSPRNAINAIGSENK